MTLPSRLPLGFASILAACALSGCTDSAVTEVSMDLEVRGGARETTLGDGTHVELTQADLAFGPFYLCAGAQAGMNCASALVEWTSAVTVDALSDAPVAIGELEGYSGRALSYMHDCGIVSLLTTDRPLVLPAAESLGGNSVRLVGVAEPPTGGVVVPFRIELVIASSSEADRGQPVVRSAPGDLDAEVGTESRTLRAHFEPTMWIAGLDASMFWQDGSCEDGGPSLVCAGTTSQNCESGESIDCLATGQICAPHHGCQSEVLLDGASTAGRSVAQAITLAAGLEIELD